MTGESAPRRLRVLHVIQNLNYGGMERLVADLVLRSDPGRFENHVLVLQYLGRFSRGLEGSAVLHQARPLPSWTMVWPGPLARVIRGIAPDVIHSHSGVWYKTSLAARLAGVPRLIHTEHGRAFPDPWHSRLVDGLAAGRTDVVVAVSAALAQHLAATVVRSRALIRVIPNGVDTERHCPVPDTGRIRQELGIPAEAPILGSIGRLEPIKGYDVMIEAFGRLRSSWRAGQPPRLVIAGDGSERQRLKALAEGTGFGQDIHLLGWRDDVRDLLSAFTLFTMSSRSEGTSVSLLEAMSAGLCPVVTRVGGNAAVLGDGLRHRLVPPEDPGALRAAWLEALEDPGARSADGARARARVQVEFGLEAMVRCYEALYEGEH